MFVLENRSTRDYGFESDELHIGDVVVRPSKSKRVDWTAPSPTGTCGAEDDKNHSTLEVVVQ